MAGTWKTARVFISSTFRDMHAERDHLVKVVFPRLRERLLPSRVELIDVDLRWGVTREQAENDRAVGLCLEQVGECELFFAFLGPFVGVDNPTSSEITRKVLGWEPEYQGLIEDLEHGHYFAAG